MRTVKNSDFTKLMLARCNALPRQLFSCAAAARDNQTPPIVHAYTADGGGADNNARRLPRCSSVIEHTSIASRITLLLLRWESEAKLSKAFSCGKMFHFEGSLRPHTQHAIKHSLFRQQMERRASLYRYMISSPPQP
jgi:hypothetical protein